MTLKLSITINNFNNKIKLSGNHKKLKYLLINYQLQYLGKGPSGGR